MCPRGAAKRRRAPSPLDRALQASTGFLLARVGMESRRVWSRMLSDRELTPGQYGALMALDQLGATSQRRLSEIIGVDPRNVVPIIDALAAARFVERRPDAADRRRHAVVLTKAGRVLVRELQHAGAELEQTMLGDLTAQERAGLHRVLHKLFARIAGEEEA